MVTSNARRKFCAATTADGSADKVEWSRAAGRAGVMRHAIARALRRLPADRPDSLLEPGSNVQASRPWRVAHNSWPTTLVTSQLHA